MLETVKDCLAIPLRSLWSRSELEAEILVLRHQLNVLHRKVNGRPPLTNWDRFLLVWLYRLFPSVLGAVAIIRPETLIRWHRNGFRTYWRWRSRSKGGRPKVSGEIRALIRDMSLANRLWGAPRIHGELLKLGFEIAQSTVDAYTNAVFRLLANLKCPKKGLVGPWAHEYPHFAKPGPQIGFLQECLRWWDHWLKGEDTGIMREPVLRVWLEDPLPPKAHHELRPGRWAAEATWPSPRITPRRWNLASWRLAEGAVTEEALSIRSPETVGLAGGSLCPHGVGHDLPTDQRVEAGGSLIFDSAPLSSDLEILGAGIVELEVSADKPVAKLACTLSEVHPDGSVERISYGLLNLAHRDSYEHPAPLEPGRHYRVKVQLKDAGHRFAAGNRIRLAISTAYWPVAWPSPEAATVTVYTGFSRLTLPIRPPRSADAALAPFPEPEAAPKLKRQLLEAPFERRLITTDRTTGEVTYEWSESDGVYRIEDIDLTVSIRRTRRVSIHPDRPNSGRSEMQWYRAYSRGDWRTSAESVTVLTSDRDHFRLAARMDAFEGEARVFSRNWDEKVSRDLN